MCLTTLPKFGTLSAPRHTMSESTPVVWMQA
ncbi:Uncharacterised protein [Vibrio cholerae]|nr:Uncharacterised protein [Vibrio cholerae]